MITISKLVEAEVDVEVTLDDFSTEDLLNELKNRQDDDFHLRLNKIYQAMVLNQSYRQELKDFIYEYIGRIV